MNERKVELLVRGFVNELTSVIEGLAQERQIEQVKQVLGQLIPSKGRQPSQGKRVMARGPNLRPCPVDGCKGTARPRDGMVCLDHAGITADQKLVYRERAKKPGGVWFNWNAQKGAGKKAKAKQVRKKKAA